MDYVRRPNIDSSGMLLAVKQNWWSDLLPSHADQAAFVGQNRPDTQKQLYVIRRKLENEASGNARCLYGRFLGVELHRQKHGVVRLYMSLWCINAMSIITSSCYPLCIRSICVEHEAVVSGVFKFQCSISARVHADVVWRRYTYPVYCWMGRCVC